MKVSIAINLWKIQVEAYDKDAFNLNALEDAMTTLTEKLKSISEDKELVNEIYPLALKTIVISSHLYKNYNKDLLHKIYADLYGFSAAFARQQSTEEHQKFFYSACLCVFRQGTDWSFKDLLIEPISDDNLFEIIEFIGLVVSSDNKEMMGKDAILNFYFHYAEKAKKQGLMERLLSGSDHPINCLLFIHKFDEYFEQTFYQWTRLYFPFIHRVFDGHLEEPSKVKVLLALCKMFKYEEDVDWAVLIFSENNIAEVIYSNPSLLSNALEILFPLMQNFTARFFSCVELLGIRRAERLVDKLDKWKVKRTQISTALSIRKLLPNLKLTAGISLAESYKKWQSTLEEMNKIKFNNLSPEDNQKITDIIRASFDNLYAEYQENPDALEIIPVLNAYIPINIKLCNDQLFEMDSARKIVSKYADICADIFSNRDQELNLRELSENINRFHGAVFPYDDFVFNLNKFTKYWKMSIFTLKVFVDFLSNIDWFHDQLAIINVQERVKKFINTEGTKDEQERIDIMEIIIYLDKDLKILAKIEANILYKAIKS